MDLLQDYYPPCDLLDMDEIMDLFQDYYPQCDPRCMDEIMDLLQDYYPPCDLLDMRCDHVPSPWNLGRAYDGLLQRNPDAQPRMKSYPQRKIEQETRSGKEPLCVLQNVVRPFIKCTFLAGITLSMLLTSSEIPMASVTAMTASTQFVATGPLQAFNVTKESMDYFTLWGSSGTKLLPAQDDISRQDVDPVSAFVTNTPSDEKGEEVWADRSSRETPEYARIKSTEDIKQTEKKTPSKEELTITPSDEKETEVLAEPSSRETPEIKSTEYPKHTKKKTPSKEVLNGVTPFFKWIHILIFLWAITMASATASTQFVANDPFQTFNVTEGTNAMIRFDNFKCRQSDIAKFSLGYVSEEQPFCRGSEMHNELIDAGFREQHQEDRFSVEGLRTNDTFSVILNVSDVSVKDRGIIDLVVELRYQLEQTRTAVVNVLIPPAKAECHFSQKAIIGHHHVVRCHAPAENGKVTLSCFQSNSKINPIDIITDNNDMIRGTFGARFGDWVQCCSHPTTDDVTQETCDQSIFHHPKSITTPISNLDSRPTTDIGSTSSSDQVCVLMSWVPLYLPVIIVAYIQSEYA